MAEEAVTLLKQFYATGNPKGLPIAHPGLNPMVMYSSGICCRITSGLSSFFSQLSLQVVSGAAASIQLIIGYHLMSCCMVCCSAKAAPAACTGQQGESGCLSGAGLTSVVYCYWSLAMQRAVRLL